MIFDFKCQPTVYCFSSLLGWNIIAQEFRSKSPLELDFLCLTAIWITFYLFTVRPTQQGSCSDSISSFSTLFQKRPRHNPSPTTNNPQSVFVKKGHRLTCVCVDVCVWDELCCDVIHMKQKHSVQMLRAIEEEAELERVSAGTDVRGRV